MISKAPAFLSALATAPSAPDPLEAAAVPRPEAVPDTELVRLFNSGDESAFNTIVARYRAKMFYVALRHLRDRSDAEEIAQDTFIRAHRNLARFRGDSSLATWLHRITFNLSRNRYAYHFRRSRHATLSLDCALSDDNQASFSDMIASEAPSPAREAATSEFSEQVVACIEKLGAGQRDILRRRIGLSESYEAIAQAFGISIGTVKSRIARARENLRALLAEMDSELTLDSSPFSWFEPARPSSRLTLARA